MSPPTISADDLAVLEDTVVRAIRSRDDSTLNVLGYGELSMALGWPVDKPTLVCKRTPPFSPSEFTQYAQLVGHYVDRLRAAGLAVAETTVMGVDRGDQMVGYLVQPMLDSDSLGHRILKQNTPRTEAPRGAVVGVAELDPDHPFLAALTEALSVVTPSVSIDAQVTNFSWDGSTLTLVDVGTPFLWDENGNLRFDMQPFLRMLPAPTRALVGREMTKLVDRWRDPRRVALDVVANLYREGLPEWVEPTVIALNRRFDTEPITAAEGRAFYEEDLKTWPLLKRLQGVERWWQESVRRRPYDWFIHSTF